MKKLLMFFSISILFFSCTNKDNNIIKDFVSFDKYYIPALVYSSIPNETEKTKKAVKKLLVFQSNLRVKYLNYKKNDSQWNTDFNYVYDVVNEVFESTKEDDVDLMSIHEKLEEIRYKYLELRKRNSIDYYLDNLTEFHVFMEKILGTVKGIRHPNDLTKDDMDKIKANLYQCIKLWRIISKKEINLKTYDFDEDKFGSLKKYNNDENLSLQALGNSILEKRAKSEIIKNAVELKVSFVKIFMLFGSFEE